MLNQLRYQIACWLWPELNTRQPEDSSTDAITIRELLHENSLLQCQINDLSKDLSSYADSADALRKQLQLAVSEIRYAKGLYRDVCKSIGNCLSKINGAANELSVLTEFSIVSPYYIDPLKEEPNADYTTGQKQPDPEVTLDADTEPGRVDRAEEQ